MLCVQMFSLVISGLFLQYFHDDPRCNSHKKNDDFEEQAIKVGRNRLPLLRMQLWNWKETANAILKGAASNMQEKIWN